MDEADWQACADPRLLQQVLGRNLSLRKMRLFLLACCQQCWGPAANEATRVALAAAEHFALAVHASRSPVRIWVPAGHVVIDCGASEPLEQLSVLGADGWRNRLPPSALPAYLVSVLEHLACDHALQQDRFALLADWLDWGGFPLARQAELFRDIVRGPFGPLLFRAAWRNWNGRVVQQLAERIYEERAFAALPILADALEEAGCTEAELLGHLRGPGPHVLGCWGLDAVLGRS